MSGHSKWAQIKHKKAGTDAKRGALFSKLSRVITVVAREGGGDPAANAKLRQAIEQARDSGMPKDNIERAIAKGIGAGGDENLRAVEYEAYGPGGSAFVIIGLTDNSNRTTSEIKYILDGYGGRLAGAGSVLWMFDRKAFAEFELPPGHIEDIELTLIDAGAADTAAGDGRIQALVAPEELDAFQKKAAERGLGSVRSGFVLVPRNTAVLDRPTRAKAAELEQELAEHQDITEVWTTIGE